MDKRERFELLNRVTRLASLVAEARSGRMSFDSEEDFLRLVGLQPEELPVLVSDREV
jgi:hypothetical protein